MLHNDGHAEGADVAQQTTGAVEADSERFVGNLTAQKTTQRNAVLHAHDYYYSCFFTLSKLSFGVFKGGLTERWRRAYGQRARTPPQEN